MYRARTKVDRGRRLGFSARRKRIRVDRGATLFVHLLGVGERAFVAVSDFTSLMIVIKVTPNEILHSRLTFLSQLLISERVFRVSGSSHNWSSSIDQVIGRRLVRGRESVRLLININLGIAIKE